MQSLKKWVFAIKSYKTRSFNKAVSESEYDKNGNLISQETEVSNDGVTETESREYAYDSNKMMTGCTITQDGTVSVDVIRPSIFAVSYTIKKPAFADCLYFLIKNLSLLIRYDILYSNESSGDRPPAIWWRIAVFFNALKLIP